LKERYRLLGQELTRIRIVMGYGSVHRFAARGGPLSEGMIGRLERGDHTKYERATLFAAEIQWRLEQGSITDFIDSRTDKLRRIDDPLRGLTDAEMADLRRKAAALEDVDMDGFLHAVKVFMRNGPALAELEAAQKRAARSLDVSDLRDVADTAGEVLSRLAAG
jgi:hypothetical protein